MIPFLPYLKAYAALAGALATALSGIYAPDTTAGQVLTVAVALATAIATFVVPNIEVTDVDGEHELGRNELGRNERGATDVQQATTVVVMLLLLALAAALLLTGNDGTGATSAARSWR